MRIWLEGSCGRGCVRGGPVVAENLLLFLLLLQIKNVVREVFPVPLQIGRHVREGVHEGAVNFPFGSEHREDFLRPVCVVRNESVRHFLRHALPFIGRTDAALTRDV